MEMRLGKTLVAIRWAQLNKFERILVVAPKSVLPSWKEELLDEEYAEQDICLLEGDWSTRFTKATTTGITWFIVNFAGLRNTRELLEFPWDCIIVDESTRIKNSKADTTKMLCLDTKHVGHKAILSGHPCPESEMDYYEQFRFLYGSFMHQHNFWYWRRHYCIQYSHGGWEVKGCFVPRIKEEVNRLAFVMTRKQAGIGSKKIYEKRYVELNEKQKKLYKQADKDFEVTLDGDKEFRTKWVPVKRGWLLKIASGFTPDGEVVSNCKLEELQRLLAGDLKGEKVVVWFRHNDELLYVASKLRDKKYGVSVYYGDCREADKFTKGDAQILCAQGKVGMMGLDWSVASTAIYYSNWDDGEIRVQSEDRIVHPKKKEPLLYIDLICRNTVDQDVIDLLRGKRATSRYFSMKEIKNLTKYTKGKTNGRTKKNSRNGR